MTRSERLGTQVLPWPNCHRSVGKNIHHRKGFVQERIDFVTSVPSQGSRDTCGLVLVLLQRVPKLFPLVKTAQQRTNPVNSVLPQLHRHLRRRRFTGQVQ